MKYSSLVSSNSNFQSSVNLQFDINKKNKIDTYIPTIQSVAILKRYLNAIYNTGFNEDNATVLIGPYGRGKSHLLLILSAIMSGKNKAVSQDCLNDLISRVKKVDRETAELAEMFEERGKPMLPVIISSNHTDINQSFILALREALERTELEDFFPETYFDSALSMIITWEEHYDKAVNAFTKHLKAHKTTLIKIKKGLSNCDKEAYSLFCEIYPQVTNGAEFNPLKNTDIVKIYSQVSKALCEQKNYSGIFIIFDEFSKFLESTIAVQNMQNFKLIQDFAELAVRSGENQIHLCCVTHKEILDYSQSDSFRTVDGRFKKVYFVASSEQSYELVANAIEHTGKFNSFYKKHNEQFETIGQAVYRTNIFSDVSEKFFFEYILKKCFPLHPIAVYSLIKVSELVGQNERTLFTFLSQSGEHTLSAFLETEQNSDTLALMTIDYIYDYFSDLFRVEVFNPRIHSVWAKANTAIKQTNNADEQKIIKALAIINIINDSKLLPVSNILKTSVNLYDAEYNYAIEHLIRNHIITLKRDRQYAFLTPNGVDIRKSIKNTIEQGLVKLNRTDILKSAYSVPYILPRQYNSEKCMMRYFRTEFMEAADFQNYNGNFSEMLNGADGLIIYLITDSYEERMYLYDKIADIKLNDNIIVCVPEPWTDNALLYEYAAACMLEKSKDSEDLHFLEELLIYKDDLFKSIQELANKNYSPSNKNSAYHSKSGSLDNITKPMLLNRELSKICNDFYNCTPVINNEMINKNHLTAQIKKARVKTIDWILAYPEEIPEMEGYGPEVSIFRSTISVHGLDKQSIPQDKCLEKIINIIEKYIVQAEGRWISFSEIFNTLTNAPYGMRIGVIPVYVAYAARKHISQMVVKFKDKEIELNGNIFNDIENSPDDFSFYVEVGTKEKTDYINSIISLFSGNEQGNASNTRNNALKLMQAWFRGLPKFARVHNFTYSDNEKKKVPNYVITLRKKLLLYDVSSYDFFFNTIPEAFGEEDFSLLGENIRNYVHESNNFIDEVKKYVINRTISAFDSKIEGSLFSVMRDWFESLSESTKKNVFDADTNYILKFISTNTDFDDDYVISSLAKNITTFAVEDWNDDTVDRFIDSISGIIENVKNYELKGTNIESQQISISLSIDGMTYEKNLSDTEISVIAETTLNNIEETLDDYGDSITAQERISILLKLLKKEIDQM